MNTQILTGAAAVAAGDERKESPRGYRRPPQDPALNARIVEAANLWHDALYEGGIVGMKARTLLAEKLTTSDFPIILGSVFDRELLKQYEQTPATWQGYATRSTVRDFKPKKLIDLLGGRGVLDEVAEGAEYKARSVSEAEYALQVAKRGNRIRLTWEMVVNDDLDAFRTLPTRLAQAARNTESHLAAGQLVTASGADTNFFKSGNGNAPTSLPLNADNLAAAIGAVMSRKDDENLPITIPSLVLVVPPALEVQANNLINATEIELEDATTKTKVRVGNWIRGKLRVVVEPWLTVIATDNKAAGRWFLLPDPNGPRPAVAVGFLRGHEEPDLRVKADTGSRIGGGSISPEDGSFDDDSIEYRVRHVVGAAQVDPKATYVSNGS